jgi:hypothetical protein
MAETPGSATGTYGEGVKWILTIASAAIAGAFIHLKEVEEQIIPVQALLALSLALFVYSIWTGMNYLLWLNTVPVVWDRLREYREELLKLKANAAPDLAKESELQGRIEKESKIIKVSEEAMPPWHVRYTYSFSAALACATLAVLLSMLVNVAAPKNKDEKKADVTQGGASAHIANEGKAHYSLVYSAMHATSKGREAHTFLMNDETGELWQMVCDGPGHVVFQKVARIETNLAK